MERMKRILACCFCLLLAMTLFLSCSAYSSNGQKTPAKGVYHKIKKGETFYSIARAYQVKLQDLAEVNNISNPELIAEGSVLFIPSANQVIDDVMTAAKAMDTKSKAASPDIGTNTGTSADYNGATGEKKISLAAKETDRNTLPVPVIADKPKASNVKPEEAAVPKGATGIGKYTSAKTQPKINNKTPIAEKDEVRFEKKQFIWPVSGSVKTRFGIQPNKTYHNWIKIVSVAGMRVKAAAAGTVIFSSALPSFGETIIIRHADNYATVYTHLKKRYVKNDQNVKKGEAIASLGEVDEAGDVYMNFEVRLKDKEGKIKSRNPLFFLP
jgi:lipoprotein NlpD